MVGWVFCAYSIAVILLSPVVSRQLDKYAKPKVIAFGLLLMGSTFILFGFTSYFSNATILAVISILLRLLQGFSSALVQTTCYSLAMSEFPGEKDKVLGYLEAIMGFGNVVGPIIGSVLYSAIGFAGAFYVVGGLMLAFALTSLKQKGPNQISEPLIQALNTSQNGE